MRLCDHAKDHSKATINPPKSPHKHVQNYKCTMCRTYRALPCSLSSRLTSTAFISIIILYICIACACSVSCRLTSTAFIGSSTAVGRARGGSDERMRASCKESVSQSPRCCDDAAGADVDADAEERSRLLLLMLTRLHAHTTHRRGAWSFSHRLQQ